VPHDATLDPLVAVTPAFLSYALSFVYVAIYWNNHHHFFHLVRHVSGMMLWANMHLLFWLSLIPFATGWMGENHFAPVPTAVYGVGLLMPAIAWKRCTTPSGTCSTSPALAPEIICWFPASRLSPNFWTTSWWAIGRGAFAAGMSAAAGRLVTPVATPRFNNPPS
jgi:hypothetical protein